MLEAPSSILIIGSGAFGLSTAWALAKRPFFNNTSIVLVDDTRGGSFPPEDAASRDSSRIVRPDYADADYAELGAEAQAEWRKQGAEEMGGQGRYSQSGLLLVASDPLDKVAGEGGKDGMSYTKASWENVTRIAQREGHANQIRALQDTAALQEFLGTSGYPGDWGYINELSGWADASKGMDWLYKQVGSTGRVRFIDAEVEELVTEGNQVTGAKLKDSAGTIVRADIVYVAAGAWTGSLIDLRGRVEATGHPLAYVDLTDEEFAVMSKQPVVFNLSTGMFVIPPAERVLKIAQHSFGYLNPVTVTGALPLSPKEAKTPIVVSRPTTHRDGRAGSGTLPADTDQAMRKAWKDLCPLQDLEDRPWKKTRLCWYSDTRDGDWLVDWHPGWRGLFIATGDSGHSFKFLPVMGEKLVDCLMGQRGSLGEKWRWKDLVDERVGREVGGKFIGLITEDGSRGGERGPILQEKELGRQL